MNDWDILWIDDEPFDLKIHVYWLEDAKYKVKHVKSAQEALQIIKRDHKDGWPYYLTIFDINIKPVPNEASTEEDAETAGIRILTELRSRYPAAHVLMVSGVLANLDEESRRAIEGVKQIDKLELTIKALPDYLAKLKGMKPSSK